MGAVPGDVDGDGFDDVVIGAVWCGESGGADNYTYFVPGPVAGSTFTEDVGILLHATAVTASGSAGDVDGDGLPEFWLAKQAWTGDPDPGGIYVVGDPGAESAELSDIAKAKLTSSDPDDCVYHAAAGVGDVDGDGFTDVLSGNPCAQSPYENGGGAYLAWGPLTGSVDLAADAVRFDAPAAETYAGWSVAGVGDTDGDGLDDFLIGSFPEADDQTGTAWLFQGR